MPGEKLNLGCGEDTREGWVNLDIIDYEGVDVVHDAEEVPYPFDADTFSEVYASHFIEHVADPIAVLKELHRVCEDGAVVEFWTPHFTNADAYADPTHSFAGFSCRFMDYVTDSGAYVPDYGVKGMYRITYLALRFDKLHYPWNVVMQPLANLAPRWWEQSPLRVFPANDVHVKLEVVKG